MSEYTFKLLDELENEIEAQDFQILSEAFAKYNDNARYHAVSPRLVLGLSGVILGILIYAYKFWI